MSEDKLIVRRHPEDLLPWWGKR